MKTFNISVLLVFLCFMNSYSQKKDSQTVFMPTGKVIIQGFVNYKYNFTKDVLQKSAFQLNRAYLGYKYDFTRHIAGNITIDCGKDDGSAYTSFVKFAYVDVAITNWLKMTLGQFRLKQFDDQENLTTYRYVSKSFADLYGMNYSADLGINAAFRINKKLSSNLSVTNGEGFKKLQDDFGFHKYAANLLFTPIEGLMLKGYTDLNQAKKQLKDISGKDSVIISLKTQQTVNFFAGYKFKEKFRIAAEYNIQFNNANTEDHTL